MGEQDSTEYNSKVDHIRNESGAGQLFRKLNAAMVEQMPGPSCSEGTNRDLQGEDLRCWEGQQDAIPQVGCLKGSQTNISSSFHKRTGRFEFDVTAERRARSTELKDFKDLPLPRGIWSKIAHRPLQHISKVETADCNSYRSLSAERPRQLCELAGSIMETKTACRTLLLSQAAKPP